MVEQNDEQHRWSLLYEKYTTTANLEKQADVDKVVTESQVVQGVVSSESDVSDDFVVSEISQKQSVSEVSESEDQQSVTSVPEHNELVDAKSVDAKFVDDGQVQVDSASQSVSLNNNNVTHEMVYRIQHAGPMRRNQILTRIVILILLLVIVAGVAVAIIFFNLLPQLESVWNTFLRWLR